MRDHRLPTSVGLDGNETIWTAVGVTLLTACAACTGDRTEPGTPRTSLEVDVSGVPRVTSIDPLWHPRDKWQVSPEPVVKIGLTDGPEPYLFANVQDATRLPNGNIVVADGLSSEVRAFSSDGVHEWTVGGPGEGPGEFDRISGIRTHGDTIQVEDRNGRARFTLQGELVDHRRIDWARLRRLANVSRDCSWPPLPKFVDDDILLVSCDDYRDPPETSETTGVMSARMLLRIPWTLNRVDTLGTFPRDSTWVLHYGADSRRMLVPPLGPWPRGVWGHSRTAGQLLYAWTGEYRIHVINVGEDGISRIVERAAGRREMTPFEVAAHQATRERFSEVTVGFLVERNGPTVRRDFDELLAKLPPLDSILDIQALWMDDLGTIWVERWTDSPGVSGEWVREWADAGWLDGHWIEGMPRGARVMDVFREDGRFLGELELPPELMVLEIGEDYILGIQRGELDVEHVVMYGLSRRPPS